jgi:hypothetical protein
MVTHVISVKLLTLFSAELFLQITGSKNTRQNKLHKLQRKTRKRRALRKPNQGIANQQQKKRGKQG